MIHLRAEFIFTPNSENIHTIKLICEIKHVYAFLAAFSSCLSINTIPHQHSTFKFVQCLFKYFLAIVRHFQLTFLAIISMTVL